MSNQTEPSRDSSGNRRRRSRGGQKRKRNNNSFSPSDPSSPKPERSGSGGQNRQSGAPRRQPMPKPAELTWWQKLMKAIGLYKEPVKPPRKPRSENPEPARQPKSNTRVARSGARPPQEGGNRETSPQEAAAPQGERRPRKSRQRGEARTGGDPSSVESARLYVGNLSYDATEQDLQELFKGIGSVRNIEVVYDRKTHRSKGFGFVEMLHVDEAKRAVEVLHDQFFMGREMVVSGAQRKGQDEREEQEDVREEKPKPVVLAPLPPAVEAEPVVAEEVATPPAEEEAAAEPAIEAVAEPEPIPTPEPVESEDTKPVV